MPVYHCPHCPLIFEHSGEVQRHVRHEHRAGANGAAADLQAELAEAAASLCEGRLRRLHASKGCPSVSLLLSTAPAAAMTVLDIARLRQLSDRARRRLAGEPAPDTPTEAIEHRLARAVSLAESMPTDRGLAVLVNHADMAVVTLPFAPRDRHVVDRRFATRDLEYALYRFPHYRVLDLGHRPRVLEGTPRRVTEVDGPAMGAAGPAAIDHVWGTPARRRAPEVPQNASPRHGCAAATYEGDRLLSYRVSVSGRMPLVLVGDRRHLDDFLWHSPYAADVVARVLKPWMRKAPVGHLVAETLSRLHLDHEQQSVADLHRAELQARVAWGVDGAWRALMKGRADRLWVEHDFAVPGRILSGYGVQVHADPTQPGVVDDLVDALIAKASAAGVPVHLLERGAMGRPDGVAARVAGTEALRRPRELAATVA